MIRTIRLAAVAIAVLAAGAYLWHGLTYEPSGPYDSGAWANGLMVPPMLAFMLLIFVFAFTGEGIVSAMTGRNSGEFRDAPTGIGTVKSFQQTGVRLNDQPQVLIEFSVETADGKVFESSAKKIVPLTELSLLRPGVVLPVRYLPGRTDRVEIDMSGDAVAAQRAMNESMIRKGFTTKAKLDIVARGVAAQAVVRALSVPGEIRDGHTKVELDLVVTRPDGSTFATRSEKFLPPAAIGNVQVGRILQVHYLPENEREVVTAIPVNA